MIINYLDVEVRYARIGRIKQSAKLGEWARNQIEKNRGAVNETNGTR